MSTRASTIAVFLLSLVLSATRAVADPVAVSGFLSGNVFGARASQQLELSFPDFKITVIVEPRLVPGFPIGIPNGTSVSFTQSTGVFSGPSSALAGFGTVDADVTGMLAFAGPTVFMDIPPGERSDTLVAPLQVSGFLRITQPDRVLFDGTLTGGGVGTAVYEDRFGRGDIRLAGYLFTIDGAAATPEPASLLLVASGAMWLARSARRRRPTATSFAGRREDSK